MTSWVLQKGRCKYSCPSLLATAAIGSVPYSPTVETMQLPSVGPRTVRRCSVTRSSAMPAHSRRSSFRGHYLEYTVGVARFGGIIWNTQ